MLLHALTFAISPATANAAPASIEMGSYWGYLLSTLLALAIALAAAWVVIRWLPRLLQGGRAGGAGPSGTILRVVARLPLEQRRTLFIVEVPGSFLLLGSGETGLEKLAELEPEAVERAVAEAASTAAQTGTVAAVVRRLLGDRSEGGA